MRKNNPIVFDEINEQRGVYCYRDIEKILRNTAKFSSKPRLPQIANRYKNIRPDISRIDPPYHTKVRSIVDTLFVTKKILELKPRIQHITNNLICKAISRGQNRMDLISDFAIPLPITVITELLGVPSKDLDTFHRWAYEIVKLRMSDLNSIRKANGILYDMDVYFEKLIETRKKKPANDLISEIITAEIDGHSLSEKEILSLCSLLLIVGHATTATLIGNLIFTLLEGLQEFTNG
jgi:cytochrome P450 family 109